MTAGHATHPARAGWSFVKPSVIPGFGLTFGYTLLYLSLIVLIPIIGLFLKAGTTPWVMLAGGLLGFVVGLRLLMRSVNRPRNK